MWRWLWYPLAWLLRRVRWSVRAVPAPRQPIRPALSAGGVPISMLKLTILQMDALLDALIAVGGPWDPAAVFTGIATDFVDKGVNTLLADLTLPTAANYPTKVITAWSAKYTLADGRRAVDGPLHHFVGVAAEPATVKAYYMADLATAGNLLGFDMVIPNKTLETAADVFDMIVRLTVDPAGKWDASVIVPT